MPRLSLAFLCFLLSFHVSSASFEKDREQILGMAGCYEIQFQFAETFPRKQGYEVRDPYFSGGLEWVEVDVDRTDNIELQHLLIVAPKTIVKHWRQEWKFEESDRLAFKGDKKWTNEPYSTSQVTNHWEQNVLQVDDSPRYECQAEWTHKSQKSFWECASWNPLPRREFSIRDDYNVLNRRNRHQLTDYGWVHEQDNEKIIVENGEVKEVLVEEKGKNIYKKVPDNRCQDARDWWGPRKKIWASIRGAWDKIHGEYSTLEFKDMGQPLWRGLSALSERALTQQWSSDKTEKEAYTLIQTHLK